MQTLAAFDLSVAPVTQGLGGALHQGGFRTTRRNAVPIGRTGTGQSHLALASSANCVRNSARGRCLTAIALVPQRAAEARAGKAGKLADQRVRVDRVILTSGALCRSRLAAG